MISLEKIKTRRSDKDQERREWQGKEMAPEN
jgi:hypothetical protein